jgi:hypothetical protein
VVSRALDRPGQLDYARRWLALDPDDRLTFYWLINQLPRAEAIAYLTPRLADRPVRVDWHRTYQGLMELEHPDKDLRPQYRQLVRELKEHPDAVYLLARLLDGAESDQLFRQAAGGEAPSVSAQRALGWNALAEGNFADALAWLEKAHRAAGSEPLIRQDYRLALLATGNYDRLLAESRAQAAGPGTSLGVLADELFVAAVKGDKAKAAVTLTRALQTVQGPEAVRLRTTLKAQLEMVMCCATGDLAGYLKQVPLVPDQSPFEPALLRGNLMAAAAAASKDEYQAVARHGLVYLAARQAKNAKLAEHQWSLLLAALAKSNRHERQLGDVLAGRRPLDVDELRRLPLALDAKRVLLAVAADRSPKQAKELRALARKLDFQRDVTSLCLRKVLGAGG